MNIVIVIPAFNEAKWIGAVVAEAKAYADCVVVVDDCSGDETSVIAEQAGAVVLRHLINRGQGAALRTGTNWATENNAEIIVHFDADGQFRAQDIPKLTTMIVNNEADVVFGSRFLDNTTKMPPVKRYLLMPLAKLVNRFFLGVRLTDPQSGFRCFNSEVAKNLQWQNDRMAHASEILGAVARGQWRVAEAPITVIYHGYGQGMSGGFKILADLFIKNLIRH